MSEWYKNDNAVDAHYARDYYGPGTDYFNPPEVDEDEGMCLLCGKEKWRWDTGKDAEYCPECKDAIKEGLWDMMAGTHASESDLWQAIDDLWDETFENSRLRKEDER